MGACARCRQRRGNRGRHESRIGHRCQVDERHAVAKTAPRPPPVPPTPAVSGPSRRTGRPHQPALLEQLAHAGDLSPRGQSGRYAESEAGKRSPLSGRQGCRWRLPPARPPAAHALSAGTQEARDPAAIGRPPAPARSERAPLGRPRDSPTRQERTATHHSRSRCIDAVRS